MISHVYDTIVEEDGNEIAIKDAILRAKTLQNRFLPLKKPNRIKSTPKNPIKCPHCPKIFHQHFRLKGHLTVHQSDKPFCCPVCGAGFKTNSAFRRHLREIHLQEQTFICTCGKEFNSKTNYVIHTKRHMAEFVVHCEHCNEGFVTKTEYRRHLDTKHDRKEYVCDTCGKNLSSERSFREHKRIHDDTYKDRFYQECTICDKKFRHLKKHIKDCHESEGNNYIVA